MVDTTTSHQPLLLKLRQTLVDMYNVSFFIKTVKEIKEAREEKF